MKCLAKGCSHTNMNSACKFFIVRRRAGFASWEKICRRRPKNDADRLCSCHFLNGNRLNKPVIHLINNHCTELSRSSNTYRRYESHLMEQNELIISTVSSTEQILDPCASTSPRYTCGNDSPADERAIKMNELETKNNALLSERTSLIRQKIQLENENAAILKEKRSIIQGLREEIQKVLKREEKLLHQNLFLKTKIEKNQQLINTNESWNMWCRIKNNNALINFYTNLPNSEVFEILYNVFDKVELCYYYGWQVDKIDRRNQLLLTLMKLRLNFPVRDLAVRFNISHTTVTNIFITWLYAIHKFLFRQVMHTVPSRYKNQTSLPACFIEYQNCRMIIDCTEIKIAVPSKLEQQKKSYSSYKNANTFKGLLGESPNGTVTYASPLFPGSYSDKEITRQCGVLELFEPGDSIMADKGFLIHDILPQGVSLNIPPFLNAEQFTSSEVKKTESIAKARIHIERAINRVKTFYILKYIPHNFRRYATTIWQTCAALTNLRPPLIKEVENSFVHCD